MSRFKIEKEGDVFHVSGALNEHTNFDPILEADDQVLQVSFDGVTSINSIGTKAVMDLVSDLSDSKVLALSDVPVFIVEMINVIPSFLGSQTKNLVSVYAPFSCTACGTESDVLIKRKEISVTRNGITLLPRFCHQCKAPLKINREPEDYFLFATYSQA